VREAREREIAEVEERARRARMLAEEEEERRAAAERRRRREEAEAEEVRRLQQQRREREEAEQHEREQVEQRAREEAERRAKEEADREAAEEEARKAEQEAAAQEDMLCPQCGLANRKNAKFCAECGGMMRAIPQWCESPSCASQGPDCRVAYVSHDDFCRRQNNGRPLHMCHNCAAALRQHPLLSNIDIRPVVASGDDDTMSMRRLVRSRAFFVAHLPTACGLSPHLIPHTVSLSPNLPFSAHLLSISAWGNRAIFIL
jgi:flagellar biosynthesis GTPase FlhF